MKLWLFVIVCYVPASFSVLPFGYSTWSCWSHCDAGSCGDKIQSRERSCTNPPPSLPVYDCSALGPSTEVRKCYGPTKDVDGGYNSWGLWSECTKDCGGGIQYRTRWCVDPHPHGEGKECSEQKELGPAIKSRSCNEHDCSEEPTEGPTTEVTNETPTIEEESTGAPTTEESSEVPTTVESTEIPTTEFEESSGAPTMEQTSEAPTIEEESTETPTTEESSGEPTTEEPTEAPTTEESSGTPTAEELSQAPTTEEESTAAATTEELTGASTTQESTEEPTTEESSGEPTTEEPTEGPTIEESSGTPTTEELSEAPTTEEESTAAATTEELTGASTTEESTRAQTVEESSGNPTTEELSEAPTTEETLTVTTTTEEFTGASTTEELTTGPPCIKALDLGIIIDKSNSVGKRNLIRLKRSLTSFVHLFDVSAKGTHVGIITFNDDAKLLFDFKDDRYHTEDQLKKGINEISLELEPQRNIDLALGLAKKLFSVKGGDRPDVPNALIIFTDGKPTGKPIEESVEILTEVKNVDIFPVGIGNSVQKSELKKLAGDKGHYYHIANFRELCSYLEELKDAACDFSNGGYYQYYYGRKFRNIPGGLLDDRRMR